LLSVRPVSACAPAYDLGFEAPAGIDIGPIGTGPSTTEGDEIGADVILAQDLERLVRRRRAFVNESIDALLSCCDPSTGVPVPTFASILGTL
jgi:hypothetical protein